MKVAFAIGDKPQARRVESVRAAGQCSNFWFLLPPGSHDLVPMPDAPDTEIARFQTSKERETAMADGSAEIGELAAAIATRLKAEAPAELVRQIDVIIVCTTGFDSPVGMSLAGKVKHIFEVPRALPFTIGQMDGTSAFEAMRIARGFIHGPDQARVVAVVSGECWWYPYFRSFGDYAQYGDGAAAMLLCAHDPLDDGAATATGIEIVDIELGRYQAQQGPFDLREPRWFDADAWSQTVGAFLAGFLRKHALSAADMVGIDSPCLDTAFVDAVARAAGLPLSASTGGFVSSVDPMLAFSVPPGDDQVAGYVLSWSVGLNGEMGACLQHRGQRASALARERGL